MAHIHMAYCLAIKKHGMLSFAGKWMKPEDIMLREICQTQKDKHLMLFIICGNRRRSRQKGEDLEGVGREQWRGCA